MKKPLKGCVLCRCPYYALAQDGLYNTLTYGDTFGSQYFEELLNTKQTNCWANEQVIMDTPAAKIPASHELASLEAYWLKHPSFN